MPRLAPARKMFPMEIFSLQFLSSLAAIVVIDLMLAGDNAIVIALAARSVPAHLQKRAIAWGTVGAVVVRSLMTLAVVWLLQIPGLMLAGGAVLVWIAYKLLLPDEGDEGGSAHDGATSFWGAMRTIVVADAVMGLDNVLAVAGAAHGSYILVVLGLLISIPIVVWGSTWLLKWVDRYPVIVYFGAGVLAWTAVKMMVSEPLVKDTVESQSGLSLFLYALVIFGVLWAGFVRNHRRLESRIHARLALFAAAIEAQATDPSDPEKKGNGMNTVLIPVGDSRNSRYAVQRVAAEFLRNPEMRVHLLNVQTPLPRHISQFLGPKTRADWHRDRAEEVLKPARAILARHAIPFEEHTRLGRKAEIIVDEAKKLGCDRIVMATARKNSLTRMLEDSTTNNVMELTTVPVELVPGDAISKLERFGIPAGLGAALALLVAEALD